MHFAPHPDDELIGAPATLMALRDAGFRVVNVACGLGRAEQRARRERELAEACRRVGFELRVPAGLPSISAGAEEAAAEQLRAIAGRAIAEERPQIVVAPGPGDLHHGHRLVAAAVRGAIAETADAATAPRLWMWALWGFVPRPTLGVRFGAERLEEILAALAAHAGELARNDYRRLVRSRAELHASLADELLFGFGTHAAGAAEYAELLAEVTLREGRWLLGSARWLDAERPLAEPTAEEAVFD